MHAVSMFFRGSAVAAPGLILLTRQAARYSPVATTSKRYETRCRRHAAPAADVHALH